jgi:hypothetical protein
MMRGNKLAHLYLFAFVTIRLLCYPGIVVAVVEAAPFVATVYANPASRLAG